MGHKSLITFFVSAMLLIYTNAQNVEIKEFEIYFIYDSDKLTREARNQIDEWLFGKDRLRLMSVELIGHCDSLGNDDYNMELSRRRAENTRLYLISKGMELGDISLKYYGRTKPKYSNSTEEGKARNRRCELIAEFVDPSPTTLDERISDLIFETGQNYVLPNLHFIANQIVPHWYSLDVMNDLLLVLLQKRGLKIEIQGHVCCNNDHRLSEARAKYITQFLIGNGIEPHRLQYKGFGNRRPAEKETSEETRMKNRRIEARVLFDSGDQVQISNFKPVTEWIFDLTEVRFFPQKNTMPPASRFNLKLIALDIDKSKSLKYVFYIKADHETLMKQRIAFVEKELTSEISSKQKFDVRPWEDIPASKYHILPDMYLVIKKDK